MRLLITGLFLMVLYNNHVSSQIVKPPTIGLPRKVGNLISYKNENYGQEGYEFQYATDDGTVREEKGSFVNGIWTVIGRYSWIDERGVDHQTVYKADDKGTQVMEDRISKGALAALAG